MPRVPERPTPVSVLASSTLLNCVPEAARDELARVSHLAFAERGETIWMTGAEVDFFGVVGVGFVKMVKSTSGGQELTQEIMGPGQVFGMLGALDGAGCPLAARAVSATWYLKVPRRAFMPVYAQSMPLHDHVVRRTTSRLRQAHELLAQLSTGTVESRVAAILIMLADGYGRAVGDGLLVDVPLTRQDIAEMAGTTVESTIRVMSRWQKQGLIRTDAKLVTLLDEAAVAGAMRI